MFGIRDTCPVTFGDLLVTFAAVDRKILKKIKINYFEANFHFILGFLESKMMFGIRTTCPVTLGDLLITFAAGGHKILIHNPHLMHWDIFLLLFMYLQH